MLCGRHRFGSVVAAGTGDGQNGCGGAVYDGFNDLIVFIPIEGRAFTGRACGENTTDAIGDLKFDQGF